MAKTFFLCGFKILVKKRDNELQILKENKNKLWDLFVRPGLNLLNLLSITIVVKRLRFTPSSVDIDRRHCKKLTSQIVRHKVKSNFYW